nr:ADP-ribosylglycohydrolase family protein [uncultured Acetatifactor sp.]
MGQLYQTAESRGLKWACVTGVAIAAGTMPGATVDSVIGAIYDNCDKDMVVKEIDEQLKKTSGCKDIIEMRSYFDGVYSGFGMPYPFSYANEVVTKGVAIFRMVGGNTKDAVLAGVNMGRDTDCVAAVAGGISGALCGSASLPEKWITQLDYATSINPHTNSRRTLRENADGLYDAFQNRLKKEKAYVEQMSME